MALIPKSLLVDIDLNAVADPAVRSALAAIVDFANGLVVNGLATNGELVAKSLRSLEDGAWSVDENGKVSGKKIELNGLGGIKCWVIGEQTLAANASNTWNLPANNRVFGAIGWTTHGATRSVERPMITSSTNGCFFQGAGNEKSVIVQNGSTSTINRYKLIIFYTE